MDSPYQVRTPTILEEARQSDEHLDSRFVYNDGNIRPYAADLDGRTRSVVETLSDASPLPLKAPPPQARAEQAGGQQPVPFQSSFWDKDPDMVRRRKLYIKVLASNTIIIILIIFGILSIFWGSLYNVDSYIHNLQGWVVDFDGGEIGSAFTQTFASVTGAPSQMTWTVVGAQNFPNGISDVQNAVVQEKAWVIVAINENASANLAAAIASANASYDGSLAVTAYTASARNENGYAEFVQPQASAALQQATVAFAASNAKTVASNSSVNLTTLLSRAPNVITSPASFVIDDLRPFNAPVAEAVDFVGLIYLLIISFIVCMVHYAARVQVTGLNRQLTLRSLLLVRMAAPITLYFFVSLFFSLLSLAFKAPFSHTFGASGFVIYWMMNWVAMCALGLAMEAMITLLTPAFIAYFLVLWIISNVSVASVPIEVLPAIFKYGYAVPFYNVSRVVRTILFDTRNQIGLNFGILFIWIAVSLITMSLFTSILRKREEVDWFKRQSISTNATLINPAGPGPVHHGAPGVIEKTV